MHRPYECSWRCAGCHATWARWLAAGEVHQIVCPKCGSTHVVWSGSREIGVAVSDPLMRDMVAYQSGFAAGLAAATKAPANASGTDREDDSNR